MDPAALLTLVETVIAKRLAGDAYDSYTEAQQSFHGMPLQKLFDERRRLKQEVALGAGGVFRLAEIYPE